MLKVSKQEHCFDSMQRNYVQTSPGMKKCVLCAKSFQTRNEFLQHGELLHVVNYVQTSPGKKKCVHCAKSFQTRTEFLQHAERLHVK